MTVEAHRALAARFPSAPTLLQGHTGSCPSAAFSPDGQRVVTASDDQTARVWDARTGQAVATLQGHTDCGQERGVFAGRAAGRDGEQDQTARVWDARTGQALATLQGHTDAVMSARFSPDGQRVVTASADYANLSHRDVERCGRDS